ncbi:MAG TPA: 50S ribosomal protein L5 [Candidatus Kapabacteria bacterium]|jgi:large subunit ribosomal protein L5|nr:50S ribosomal protein L5 [Ignavibacteria bacterium]HRE57441.1 50S ribosomal protein L5 [Candidatus Kapabacteria bacterium]HRI31318.1 50S ribosomal protein L5 [Candidatus Kapabacteria bacterium]HRK58070.1 50S ribosomal protein L5 [Candidatus Kapabacteria bacterium]
MAKKQTTSKKFDIKPEGARIEQYQGDIPTPRLKQFYREQIIPNLMKQFGYKSIMQVPKLEKICLNMGVGVAVSDPKNLQAAVNELELIAGQRPAVTRSKKSIANFKLREGMPIGCHVTLRQARMFEFLDRFVNITSPRVRDFRGFSDKGFDGRGNLTIGIKEQIIFPEIDVDKVNRITGMDITFVTSASTDEEAYALLKEFGFPFRKA